MRYLFYAVVYIVSLIFTGAVFPNLNIAGIHPDIIVVCIVSIAILEKSMSGAMIGLVCGLTLDILFSSAIGIYAIPYFIVGAVAFFARKNLLYIDRFLLPTAFVVGAYLLKELISALIAYMMGIEFTFAHMFVRFTLPKTAATAVLMLLLHMLFSRIYRSSSMTLKRSDDFKHL